MPSLLLLRLPPPMTVKTTSAHSIAGSSEPSRLLFPLRHGESARPQEQQQQEKTAPHPSSLPDPTDPRIDPILSPHRDTSSGATRSSTRRGTVSRAGHRERGDAPSPRRRGLLWTVEGGEEEEEGNAARRAGTGSRAVVERDRLLLRREWHVQIEGNATFLFGAVRSGERWRPSEVNHPSFGAVQRPARTGPAAR